MSKLDFSAIAQVVSAAKSASENVQSLKAKLAEAELSAAYADVPSAALMGAAYDQAAKSIIIAEGGKWDNKAQKWDSKGQAISGNLATIAKDSKGRYYNYDNKVAVTLDTEARLESYTKALRKEYIRRRKDGAKVRERKDLAQRISDMYTKLSAALTGDVLINAVAGALHCTAAQVTEAIKK